MKRPRLKTRKIYLRTEAERIRAHEAIDGMPLDEEDPPEVSFGERVAPRTSDQNSAMWAGPLKDISEQAWVEWPNGQKVQLSDKGWHEIFKRLYLPEEYDPELCKSPTYRKWEYDEKGEPILVGSTQDLTKKGFSIYMTQITADGANRGVMFSAVDREIK